MEPKHFRRRIWAMVALLGLMLTGMGATLYDLQINKGEDYYAQSQYKIAEQQTVESARGLLLDRNGQVLVSNRVVYQVTLDTAMMGKPAQRNATLLALVQAARAEGVVWNDSLPISTTTPFAFTTDTPYAFTETDHEGTPQLSLTRLGKLAVKMKWIRDPTARPEEEQQPAQKEERGFFQRLKELFSGGSQPQTAAKPSLPSWLSAQELLGAICRAYEIGGEGMVDEKAAASLDQPVPALNIGDMDPLDARAVAGILYELALRSKEIYMATEYVFAEDVGIDLISRVKEQGLAGVSIEPTTVRQYHTPYAAHLLGRVTPIYATDGDYYKDLDWDGDGVGDYQLNDTVGREGAEKAFEKYLRGTPGIRTVERNDAHKITSQQWLKEPEPGDNVVLTLDIGLQAYVEELLASSLPQLESEETEGGACVVLDVDTAQVLTAASYPTFDLANYSRDYNDNLNDPLTPFNNRALSGLYPPGSTFKMITAVAGLEEGIITPKTKIRDEGRYTYWPGPAPQCWIYRQYRRTHGLIDVTEAIEVSCNYFFFDVGRQLGIDRLADYARRFGLGQKTGLELQEKAGIMAGPEYTESMGGTWYEGAITSVAIGQESTQVTPIQLANYIATLVNGGTRNATHLLKEVKSSDFSQVLYTQQPQALSTIQIQDQNLEAVKAGMLALTSEGGSLHRHFKDLPFQVGAKTGSAQVSAQTQSHAVFVCFAPYEDPEIAVALVVEHGGSGSELAAMAADILGYYFSSQETRDELPQENTLIR